MLSGIHSPNAAFTSQDLVVIYDAQAQRPRFQSVKLLEIEGCKHSLDELGHLQVAGIHDFTVRLPDTRKSSGDYYGLDEYVDECFRLFMPFYGAGVRRASLCNEANWLWIRHGFGPYQFVWFMKRAARKLRHRLPPDVQLIMPPLSFAPALWTLDPTKQRNPTDFILDDWLKAYEYDERRDAPNTDHPGPLFEYFDLLGANVYWQSLRQMTDPSFGASPTMLYNRYGHKKVVVLELANSAHEVFNQDGSPHYTPAEVEAMRQAQYPAWLNFMSVLGIVEASYVYLGPGATDQWNGYKVSRELADVMARALQPAMLQGQSLWMGGGKASL
jgi:hypothetical protein